jgi:hypothetical protein
MTASIREQSHLYICTLPSPVMPETVLNETFGMRAIPGKNRSEVAKNVNPHFIPIGPMRLHPWDVPPITIVSCTKVNPVMLTCLHIATPKDSDASRVDSPVLLRKDEPQDLAQVRRPEPFEVPFNCG